MERALVSLPWEASPTKAPAPAAAIRSAKLASAMMFSSTEVIGFKLGLLM